MMMIMTSILTQTPLLCLLLLHVQMTTSLFSHRWINLVPPLPTRPDTPEEKIYIPDEYKNIDDVTISYMSPLLQATARRLETPIFIIERRMEEERIRSLKVAQGLSPEEIQEYLGACADSCCCC